MKTRIRKFFKAKPKIKVMDLPVSPGNQKAEVDYVQSIDPYLVKDIPDPSDAVLVAAACKSRSIVLTKDKHHLFTALLKNYLQRWGLRVLKDFTELRK